MNQLLSDRSLGQSAVLANQFQVYDQLSQQVMQLECYPLTFLERYGEADRQMTRLCARFAQEVYWKLFTKLPFIRKEMPEKGRIFAHLRYTCYRSEQERLAFSTM